MRKPRTADENPPTSRPGVPSFWGGQGAAAGFSKRTVARGSIPLRSTKANEWQFWLNALVAEKRSRPQQEATVTHIALAVVVLGAVTLALAVDVAFVAGWLRRRW